MKETKLLNCPFCGGETFIRQNKDAMKTYSAYCGNEDCSASPKVSAYGKEMAIQLWNTRKPMERILERLEEKAKEYTNDDLSYRIPWFGIEEAIEIVKEEGGIE